MSDLVKNKKHLLDASKNIWTKYSTIFVFLILFVILAMLTDGRFASYNNITTILRNASTIGLIAVGMTFVIIAGGIDLSSGPVMATAGMVLVFLQGSGTPLPLAMLVCILVATSFGLINGIIITKAKVPPFIVTLAVGIIARSVTMYIGRGATITGDNTDTLFKTIGNGSILTIPIPFIILMVVAAILTVLLVKTKFGTFVFAVGCNEVAAKYSGIKVDNIKILTYVIAGICVGLAGIIETSRMVAVSSTTTGSYYEFDAITAVLVGGTSLMGGQGTIYGSVIGAIILFFVNNIMIHLNISTYLTGAIKGAVIMIAVLLQARNRN